MSITVRKTGGREELDVYANMLRGLLHRVLNSCAALPVIGNGTTAGNLRTTAAVVPNVDGVPNASLASSDDFWDLSAEVDTGAAEFRAYWLYVSSANAASFVASPAATSEADALRALPVLDATKSILGVYVAGVATDFDDAGGLVAQGTVFDRVPDGASKVVIDTDITLVAP